MSCEVHYEQNIGNTKDKSNHKCIILGELPEQKIPQRTILFPEQIVLVSCVRVVQTFHWTWFPGDFRWEDTCVYVWALVIQNSVCMRERENQDTLRSHVTTYQIRWIWRHVISLSCNIKIAFVQSSSCWRRYSYLKMSRCVVGSIDWKPIKSISY